MSGNAAETDTQGEGHVTCDKEAEIGVMRLQAKDTKEAGTTVGWREAWGGSSRDSEGSHPHHTPHTYLISGVWILGVRFHCSELPSLRSF